MTRWLRWASLIVTDRRWAPPLSALALGFGLFVGVAIGPGAPGTLATGVPQVIEIPDLIGGTSDGGDSGDGGSSPAFAAPAAGAAGGGGGSIPSSGSALPSFAPAPLPSAPPSSSAPPAAPAPSDPEEEGAKIGLADAVVVAPPDAPTQSECADLTAILVQIYLDDPIGLPYGDPAGLQAAICPPVDQTVPSAAPLPTYVPAQP